MGHANRERDDSLAMENAELRRRLEEAEDTLRAIQSGSVDAFVVSEGETQQVYTLASADRPYRLLVERMQQGAATLDKNGTIVYSNLRFAEMLQRSHTEVIGMAFVDTIAAAERTFCEALLREAHSGSSQGEIRLRVSDDSFLPALVTINVLPADCGAALGVLITDLTSQKHQQELTEADRRKDEFLAVLAHELRGPLAPMRNAMMILQSTDSPGQSRSATEVIERQLAHMVRLIDDLLDVSRITRGTIVLRKEPVTISGAVLQAVESARPLMDSREQELTVDVPAQPLYLDADPARLAQIVGNLLHNASKFTEKRGHIWLTVKPDNDQVTMSVRDTGIGIASDELPRIFDMFVQLDKSLERSAGGLGIGLTLIKNLVDLHGGTIEARSEGIGRGSEFIVRLPMLITDNEPVEKAAIETTEVAPRRRVLVVDDNNDSAESLSILLGFSGHETRIAHDGIEAFRVADEWRPEVMLLDIGLPKLNGFEVARKIRQQAWGRDIVLVALTGWGQPEDRRKSGEAGFDGHLVKPISHEDLLKIFSAEQRQTTRSNSR